MIVKTDCETDGSSAALVETGDDSRDEASSSSSGPAGADSPSSLVTFLTRAQLLMRKF